MRQLPEICEECGRQITVPELCYLPDGTEKRAGEVTFGESVEGVPCGGCAGACETRPR